MGLSVVLRNVHVCCKGAELNDFNLSPTGDCGVCAYQHAPAPHLPAAPAEMVYHLHPRTA
jgi:hypothetical protein